jgi:hypothetical protein
MMAQFDESLHLYIDGMGIPEHDMRGFTSTFGADEGKHGKHT